MNRPNIEKNAAVEGDERRSPTNLNDVATDLRQTVYVVGTDEAGYGPNLGPLVVGASCWRIRFDASDVGNFADPNAKIEEPDASQNENASPPKKRAAKTKKTRDAYLPLFDFSLNGVGGDKSQTDKRQDVADRAESIGARLFQRANGAVERLNAALSAISDRRGIFPLVDSKKLYGATKSLAALERSFWLAALLTNGANAATRREILTNATFRNATQLVAREGLAQNDDATKTAAPFVPPWERDADFPLPADAKTKKSDDDFHQTLNLIEQELDANDVELIDLSARRVQPLEFNELADELGLKSALIAEVTTSLAVETLLRATRRDGIDDALPGTPPIFIVLCDKLGGRDRYEPLLSTRFPGAKIETVAESRAASVYRFAARRGVVRGGNVVEFPTETLVEIRFTAKGESNVPTALASIAAKYFRELSMIPFNEFWRRETNADRAANASESVVELRPTAGYPLDAKRFRADVDETRRRLGIGDDVFWRKK